MCSCLRIFAIVKTITVVINFWGEGLLARKASKILEQEIKNGAYWMLVLNSSGKAVLFRQWQGKAFQCITS